jgi:hypothetical protein
MSIAAAPLAYTGKCRVCGCTMDRPCELDDGLPCSWLDTEGTLCTNPVCVGSVPLETLEQLHIPAALNG